ncbi:cytosine permease [Streptomyces sp. NPDC002386]
MFGRRGNYLPTAVQAVVVVGWCAVNTWIVLDLVVALLGRIGALDPHAGNTAVKIVVAALVMAVQVAVSLAATAPSPPSSAGRSAHPGRAGAHVGLRLVLLAPWAGIVLLHYGVVERKVTSFDRLFDPVGSRRLPDVRWRAILAFAVGVLCTWLFMDGSVAALRGPLSLRLHGIDLSWLAGALSAGALYALLAVSDGRRWVRRRESADALPHPGAAATERLQT